MKHGLDPVETLGSFTSQALQRQNLVYLPGTYNKNPPLCGLHPPTKTRSCDFLSAKGHLALFGYTSMQTYGPFQKMTNSWELKHIIRLSQIRWSKHSLPLAQLDLKENQGVTSWNFWAPSTTMKTVVPKKQILFTYQLKLCQISTVMYSLVSDVCWLQINTLLGLVDFLTWKFDIWWIGKQIYQLHESYVVPKLL